MYQESSARPRWQDLPPTNPRTGHQTSSYLRRTTFCWGKGKALWQQQDFANESSWPGSAFSCPAVGLHLHCTSVFLCPDAPALKPQISHPHASPFADLRSLLSPSEHSCHLKSVSANNASKPNCSATTVMRAKQIRLRNSHFKRSQMPNLFCVRPSSNNQNSKASRCSHN